MFTTLTLLILLSLISVLLLLFAINNLLKYINKQAQTIQSLRLKLQFQDSNPTLYQIEPAIERVSLQKLRVDTMISKDVHKLAEPERYVNQLLRQNLIKGIADLLPDNTPITSFTPHWEWQTDVIPTGHYNRLTTQLYIAFKFIDNEKINLSDCLHLHDNR